MSNPPRGSNELKSPNRPLSLIVNADNFKPYLLRHGLDRATAYYETLDAIVKRIKPLLVPHRPKPENIISYYDPEHSANVRRGLKDFYFEKYYLVNAVDGVFPIKPQTEYLTIVGKAYLQGYKDATFDMLQEHYNIFYKPDESYQARYSTYVVHSKADRYAEVKTELLGFMKSVLENPPNLISVPFR